MSEYTFLNDSSHHIAVVLVWQPGNLSFTLFTGYTTRKLACGRLKSELMVMRKNSIADKDTFYSIVEVLLVSVRHFIL